MKIRKQYFYSLSMVMVFFLLASCAPEVSFYVTRPAKLTVENVESIEFGSFKDILDSEIKAPHRFKRGSSARLSPKVTAFKSNLSAAELVKSMLVAGLSKSGQYRLINSGAAAGDSGGTIPDAAEIGVIQAKVKYFERSFEDAEEVFYLLLATKSGLDFRDKALLIANREIVIAAAERSRKGFKVDTPYVEKVAAMEVTFELERKSTGNRIVESQTFRSYFIQKWGGLSDTSHLPPTVRSSIIGSSNEQSSLFDVLLNRAERIEQVLLDPEEFLAMGGKLQNNSSVPDNSLDIQMRLANHIVDQYLKMISQYTEKTVLDVASGDAIAVNFIRGNAYEKAINRLENMERKEEDSFNLALAYESIGEIAQAVKYYQEAIDKDPGNKTYKDAIRRVSNR